MEDRVLAHTNTGKKTSKKLLHNMKGRGKEEEIIQHAESVG